jgi:hypothetical protein
MFCGVLPRLIIRGCVIAAFLMGGARALAALPVDIEVAVVKAAPLGAMQEWGKRLNELGLSHVRLRGAHAGDKPSITPINVGEQLRFQVVGVLNDRDQLILRGGAFGPGDMEKLKEFLAGLGERLEEEGVERGIFGLTKPQFEEVYKRLSIPVDATTKGVTPEAAFASLTQDIKLPIDISPEARATLHQAPPLATEAKGFSLGTSLAIVLRSAGLAMFPEQPRGKPFALHVVHIEPKKEYWPAGWKPEKTGSQVAPAMYRFTTVEINGFTLAQALDALAPHMGVPLVFDERVMAARKIDLAKIEARYPKGKTYVRRAVDHILSAGGLVGELRVDEANKPFYWITHYSANTLPREEK